MSKDKKARSPYQRYAKAPYLYSPQYQAWRRAFATNTDVSHAHGVWYRAHGQGLESNKRLFWQSYRERT